MCFLLCRIVADRLLSGRESVCASVWFICRTQKRIAAGGNIAHTGTGIVRFSLARSLSVRREVLRQTSQTMSDVFGRGETPLHVVSRNGHLPSVQRWVDHGADPDIQCNRGTVPLYHACQRRHFHVAQYLVEDC